MNLHGLRLFHEVAKYGSVTKASEVMRISQPSVTSQIKKLEKDEGIQLLVPAGRGIQLTTLGIQVYHLTKDLFAVEQEIAGLFQKENEQTQEVLRLGGNYLTVNHLIPDWLRQCEGRYPGGIQLATLNSYDLLSALLEGQLDVVILGASNVNDPRLVRHKVYADRLCFIAQPDSLGMTKGEVMSLETLAEINFIGRERTSFTQQSLEELYRTLGLSLPQFSLIYNNSRDALQAALAGKGIHYCSFLMVSEEIKKGTLVELDVNLPMQKHDIYLYHRKNNECGKVGREFKELILKKEP